MHQLWGEFHFSSRQLRVTSCIHSLDLPSVGLFPSGHRILVSFISRQRLLLPQALYMLGSTRPTFTTLAGNRCSISTVGRYRSPSLKITRPDAPLKLVCWRKVFNSLWKKASSVLSSKNKFKQWQGSILLGEYGYTSHYFLKPSNTEGLKTHRHTHTNTIERLRLLDITSLPPTKSGFDTRQYRRKIYDHRHFYL